MGGMDAGWTVQNSAPKILKVAIHAVIICVLYILFSYALYLGLQVRPVYGTVAVIISLALIALYIYFGFIRK